MPSAPQNDAMNVLRKYDISSKYLNLLYKMKGFKMVLICDDSTSMREILNGGQTKWDELKRAVEIVVDMTQALQIECDVLFLNREGLRNIQSFSQLGPIFAVPPYGNTPLNESFNMAISFNKGEFTERKLNVIIFTDGCPTSNSLTQSQAINEFKNTLKNRQPIEKIFVTICACTDDDYALEYLNNWDRKIKYLDVVDDYLSERKEVYKHRSKHEPFSFGDYVAKMVIGPSNKEIDQADEPSSCTLL